MDIRLFHLIATVIDACDQRPSPGPGHPPTETISGGGGPAFCTKADAPLQIRPAARYCAAACQALGREGFAGEGSCLAGRRAARAPPDPRYLFGTGRASGDLPADPNDTATAEAAIPASRPMGARTGRLPRDGGQCQRHTCLRAVCLAAFAVMARIRTVFADKGYDAERHRELCTPCHQAQHPQARGHHAVRLGENRWPVERSNAWVLENPTLGVALRSPRLRYPVPAADRLYIPGCRPLRQPILKTASVKKL